MRIAAASGRVESTLVKWDIFLTIRPSQTHPLGN